MTREELESEFEKFLKRSEEINEFLEDCKNGLPKDSEDIARTLAEKELKDIKKDFFDRIYLETERKTCNTWRNLEIDGEIPEKSGYYLVSCGHDDNPNYYVSWFDSDIGRFQHMYVTDWAEFQSHPGFSV